MPDQSITVAVQVENLEELKELREELERIKELKEDLEDLEKDESFNFPEKDPLDIDPNPGRPYPSKKPRFRCEDVDVIVGEKPIDAEHMSFGAEDEDFKFPSYYSGTERDEDVKAETSFQV